VPERGSGRAASRAPRIVRRAGGPALVTVGIGNSRTVVGLFHGTALRRVVRFESGRTTAAEAARRLERLARGLSTRDVAGAVLCSVVPALTRPWARALARWSGRAPLEVGPATARSLPIHYHNPRTLGADRIANAVAARDLYGTPVIVVDLGTATNFDCVSASGEFLGGAIAPGVGTSAEELFRRAARLPRVELRRPRRAMGRTTKESLRSGVVWGAAGQVDALVRRLAREMKGTPQVIATGGWAKLVAPECATVHVVDESLALKGMRILWEERA